MIKKSSTIIALGIILCSNVLPAIAETSSVIPKETAIRKPSESSDLPSSQSSTIQKTSDSTTSGSTIDNENQELQKSQDEKTRALTATTVQNKSAINTLDDEATSSDDIASGTFGTSAWRIDAEGTLHIGAGDFSLPAERGWNEYNENIKQISIDGEVMLNSDSDLLFSGLSNVTTIKNINLLNSSNVTDMDEMFSELNSLTNLDLSHFDTSKVTDMRNMFTNDSNLKSINVSSFSTSNVIYFNSMFSGDTSLTSLDLSSFDMTNAQNTYALLHETYKLQNLTLGQYSILEAKGLSPLLPEIDTNSKQYTGRWIKVKPNNSSMVYPSSNDFTRSYDGSSPGEYTWESSKAADVTVKYLDSEGNEIHKAQTISGNVGEAYDASTAAYKIDIDGYTLDTTKLPNNATGTLSDTAQTVTYVYTKNPVKAADVTVKYLDVDGNEIHTAQKISGYVGEAYDASTDAYKLAINGYTLDTTKLPNNATGTLSDTAQTITYVYKKTEAPTPPVKPTSPTKPEQPIKPTPSSNSIPDVTAVTSSLPQTGDNQVISILMIFLGALLLSLSTILAFFKIKKIE